MNKRGISPLLATVLIIGFTIVLAVLVIAWLSGVFETKLGAEDCTVKGQEFCSQVNMLIDLSASNDSASTTASVAWLGTGAEPTVRIVFIDSTGITQNISSNIAWVGGQGTATFGEITSEVEARVFTTPEVPGVVCGEVACAPLSANVVSE